MLWKCDPETGGPILANLASKYLLDFKEKSHEAARLKAESMVVFRAATHVCLKAQLKYATCLKVALV